MHIENENAGNTHGAREDMLVRIWCMVHAGCRPNTDSYALHAYYSTRRVASVKRETAVGNISHSLSLLKSIYLPFSF